MSAESMAKLKKYNDCMNNVSVVVQRVHIVSQNCKFSSYRRTTIKTTAMTPPQIKRT